MVEPGCNEPQRLVRVLLLLGEVRDRDVGALAGERERHGPADAGVAAGDQGAPALKAAAAAVALLAVVRVRAHLPLVAGVVQLQLGLLRCRELCRRVLRGCLVVGHAGRSARDASAAPATVS
jgi:hypothetical protein